MLIKILILILFAVLAALLLYILYSKKCIQVKSCVISAVCCGLILVISAILLFRGNTNNNGGNKGGRTEVPSADPVDREEEKRTMDMIMWYDIDTGPTTNGRPVKGWWPLNPNHPEKVTVDGNYRTTTPLMGLYDQRDPETARQHLYWISALGCNGITVDWTNYTSYRFAMQDSGADWYKYCFGVYKNTEVLLQTASQETTFEAPKTYITARLHGTDVKGLKDTLDDVYALYELYPDTYYKLADGTAQAEKPFVVIFIDAGLREQLVKGTWNFTDERFNIRFSNGYLGSSTTLEENGTWSIAGNVPLWLFVEAETDPSAGNGMYRIYHKDSLDGSVEQMIAWASLHRGGENWDELNHIINGMTTFERTLRGVAELSPKALLVNRFNYAMAWKKEPQEGMSLYASTHIEPNEDFGFLVFDNVKENLYKLNGWRQNSPKIPKVTVNTKGDFILNLSEFPTEYRVGLSERELNEWVYYNVNDGLDIPKEWAGSTCYIQTRNTFGESTVAAYTIPVTE